MKRVIVLICIVLMVGAMAFAGGQQEAAGGMEKVAFIPGEIANPSRAFAAKMFEKHAAEYNFDVTILDGKGDAQVETQLINNAVAQKFAAIFVNPNDINAVIPRSYKS